MKVKVLYFRVTEIQMFWFTIFRKVYSYGKIILVTKYIRN